MSNISTMVDTYRAKVDAMQKEMQDSMKALFKCFFDANPDVKIITWTQYTPYFNDGEECIFGVNEMSFDIEDHKELPDDVYNWEYNHREYPQTKNFQEFAREINNLPNEVFKGAFGDHVQVIARPTGFTVEEYDHD